MKKMIAVLAIAMVPFTAARADNDAGCGLGTQLMAGNEGVLYKLLATYTNGLFFNGTFGITSGTLGCNGRNKVTVDAGLVKFASANIDQLSAEMASGEGEALSAFASIYGVAETDRAAFYGLAKANYASIFASTDVTADEIVNNVNGLLATNAQLAHYAM